MAWPLASAPGSFSHRLINLGEVLQLSAEGGPTLHVTPGDAL